MMVLGRGAFSYERGTPVSLPERPLFSRTLPPLVVTHTPSEVNPIPASVFFEFTCEDDFGDLRSDLK